MTVVEAPSETVLDTFTDTDGTLLASHTGETGATWTAYRNAGTTNGVYGNRLAPVVGTGRP